MKEVLKQGSMLFGRLVIVCIMSFFICISISVLTTAAFTNVVGYEAYGYTKDSEDSVHLYTYYKADGEDTQKAKFEAEGYTVTTSNIRSDLSKTGTFMFNFTTQLFCFLILVAFIYPALWQLGTKDSNLVRFKHKPEDIYKGAKIGAVAAIPSVALFLFYLVMGVLLKSNLLTAIYKFLNCAFFPTIQLILGKTYYAAELNAGQYILLFLLLFIVPLVSFCAYLLGYKNISLSEKIIYKKNKNK